jgi:hypothetical protein
MGIRPPGSYAIGGANMHIHRKQRGERWKANHDIIAAIFDMRDAKPAQFDLCQSSRCKTEKFFGLFHV